MTDHVAAQAMKADTYQDLRAGKAKQKDKKEEFSRRMSGKNIIPVWDVIEEYGPAEPKSKCVPAIWHYKDIRPELVESSTLISAKESERRGLLMHNPGLSEGTFGPTPSLVAGYQIILPNELVVPHRHSWTAFRFFIEGDRGYTSIEGEKIYMKPGDMVVQPPRLWHHHGNDGDRPVIWVDGLDVGIVSVETSFMQSYAEDSFPEKRKPGDSAVRYGSNVLPVNFRPTAEDYRPYHYPFERTLEALETLRRSGEFDPYDDIKVRYINPLTGGYAMPNMAAYMQLLPKGCSTVPYRSTDGTVFVVAQGSGETTVGDTSLKWEQWDTFVVPSWSWYQHKPSGGDALLFSYSDRAAQEKLGLWCEERGNNPGAPITRQ